MVLALPEFGTEITNREEETGKRHGRAQIEATRNGARPCPFTRYYLQQARTTKTGDRIDYLHWLPLKNPASHRNPQRCISQMPDFHRSLPHDRTLYWERDYEGPVVISPYCCFIGGSRPRRCYRFRQR